VTSTRRFTTDDERLLRQTAKLVAIDRRICGHRLADERLRRQHRMRIATHVDSLDDRPA